MFIKGAKEWIGPSARTFLLLKYLLSRSYWHLGMIISMEGLYQSARSMMDTQKY